MRCFEDEPIDYGFNEPDDTYLFTNTDGEVIKLYKNRNWFDDLEMNRTDFYITWSLKVDNRTFMHFPKGVDRETVVQFAGMQWEEDVEETREREQYESELYHEHQLRQRGIEW